ncbi:S-methyl-5-thioribose kinase [Paenibacillus harenae]|uniref:Methylthioribose kinase n=1 Tax=Paenibacillus harenae TaxID=306543 RepID=A0ABT9U5U3_PAEHA|nr:S-methyl-5-thioribose kinase [Paenibacillus harenae]MDQ0058886.1 5-methylthioribose kinase [Paenibacillus harenae]MDQ0114431.1 5-methylthioribose kinase [Paenibacillus harenae]
MSAYHPLNEEEAIRIARSIEGFFPQEAELRSREIGDGNLNLVFHIADSVGGKSLIMKQALPYAKVVGESWPLTLDRARIESEKLILEAKLAPGLVPTVYKYDAELALTVMEDLSDHVIMRQGLINGTRYPKFADDISTFMARTLFYTSDLGMNQQDKKNQVKSFINPDLCKITEDLIFDDPYTVSSNNSFDPAIADAADALTKDSALHLEVAILREKFLTNAQALLHGDLHTGSIFVTPESTKVIDPEFAYYGPIGFDIGAVIANLLLDYAGQEHWMSDEAMREDFRQYLITSIIEIWNQFESKFRTLWNEQGVDRLANSAAGYQDYYMKRLLQDAVGFAGCKMVRRVVGLAHVADIDRIPDDATREKAQRLALAIGTSLIRGNRQTQTIEQAIDTALTAAGK